VNCAAVDAVAEAEVAGGISIQVATIWQGKRTGNACSSDHYLRLSGDGGQMLKEQTAPTAARPTATA
jgi:hypothetical protein